MKFLLYLLKMAGWVEIQLRHLAGQAKDLLVQWSSPLEFLGLVAGLNYLGTDPLFSMIGALLFTWLLSRAMIEKQRILLAEARMGQGQPTPLRKESGHEIQGAAVSGRPIV